LKAFGPNTGSRSKHKINRKKEIQETQISAGHEVCKAKGAKKWNLLGDRKM
jgi:hypothetical protein